MVLPAVCEADSGVWVSGLLDIEQTGLSLPAWECDTSDLQNIMSVESPLACVSQGVLVHVKLWKACLKQKDAAFMAHLQCHNAASMKHQHVHVLTILQQVLMPD